MFRRMCRAKIHNATVTAARPEYEGSIAVDKALLEAAGIREMEMVFVFDSSNGNRFETYAVAGEPGKVEVLGAAAKLCRLGDKIIIVAESLVDDKELEKLESKIVVVGDGNELTGTKRKKQG